MREKYRLGWLGGLGLVVMAILTGCAAPAPAATVEVQRQAEVRSVEVFEPVSNAGAPVALARGVLPDGCARLGNAVVSPGGRLIAVILPMYTAGEARAGCGEPAGFERLISLGGELPPGDYVVSVNGVQASFVIKAKTGGDAAGNLPAQGNPTPPAQETGEPPAAEEEQVDTPPGQPVVQEEPEVQNEHPAQAQPAAGDAAPPEPAPEPEPPDQSPPAEAACEDRASFFADVSVPDGSLFSPGEKFTKTWRIRNAGSCTWKGYRLVFQQGDLMNASSPFAIGGEVRPGDTVDISLPFTAPANPGAYYSDWLLSTPDGRIFGLGNPAVGLLWTRIGVRARVPGTANKVCAYLDDRQAEADIVGWINEARQERGLAALVVVDALSAAAREHSRDMACANFVEHYGSDGSTWYSRIQAQGVPYRSASENIYAGSPQFGGAPAAFAWWMNSQVHRDNILNPKAKQVGVGYAFTETSRYKGYYTINFIE